MRTLICTIVVLGCLTGAPALAAQRSAGAKNLFYQPASAREERLLYRAREMAARKDYPAALATFDELIAAQPQFVMAITERGFTREDTGDLAGAMADYDAVLRLAPDRPNAWSHAGWIRALRGVELDRALAYCDKAVSLDASVDPLGSRGFVHFQRGEFGLAVADFDAALRLLPRTATTLYLRGLAKRRSGDLAGGEADIAKALKLNPGIVDHWKKLGIEA
ncbi:MAG: tetratricopeptide repeat protein [Caulobacter sp.]|nr:tetratricopeptide repeat protein [Caulobacter sp.]